jgi:integrase
LFHEPSFGQPFWKAEVCHLRVGDIDSQRRSIHVRYGKGGRDRYVMLGERVLLTLRTYGRAVRPAGELLHHSGLGGHVGEP